MNKELSSINMIDRLIGFILIHFSYNFTLLYSENFHNVIYKKLQLALNNVFKLQELPLKWIIIYPIKILNYSLQFIMLLHYSVWLLLSNPSILISHSQKKNDILNLWKKNLFL